MLSLLALASCTTIVKTKQAPAKQAPPGQVKKTTGSKSAAPYAPGQQKKKQK